MEGHMPRFPDLPADYGFGTWRDIALGLILSVCISVALFGGFALADMARHETEEPA